MFRFILFIQDHFGNVETVWLEADITWPQARRICRRVARNHPECYCWLHIYVCAPMQPWLENMDLQPAIPFRMIPGNSGTNAPGLRPCDVCFKPDSLYITEMVLDKKDKPKHLELSGKAIKTSKKTIPNKQAKHRFLSRG